MSGAPTRGGGAGRRGADAAIVAVLVLLILGCGAVGVGDAGPVASGVASSPGLSSPADPSPTGTATATPGATLTASPGTTASDAPSDAPTVDPSPGASATPAATARPTASPTEAPIASPPPPPPTETVGVRVYFFLDAGRASDPALVPVHREVTRTPAIATAAVRALLEGPTGGERSSSTPMTTRIPADTLLLGIVIENGVATVDLSREFEAGGGSASRGGRLAQVVYTLTQFPTVASVRFELDGEPVDAFSGDGTRLQRPATREDYLAFLPLIFVDQPAWGAPVSGPVRITGRANTFEATFRLAILDRDAHVELTSEVVTATCGTGCWGEFDVTVRYGSSRHGNGVLRVWDESAKDGSPQNVREYPLRLVDDD